LPFQLPGVAPIALRLGVLQVRLRTGPDHEADLGEAQGQAVGNQAGLAGLDDLAVNDSVFVSDFAKNRHFPS
jgi:hypothetical protein